MKIASIDLETTGLSPLTDKVTSIAIVTEGREVCIDVAEWGKDKVRASLSKLRDYDVVIAHNAKFDASFIYTNFGILLDNLFCTMLASQIIQNGKPFRHSLLACLSHYCGIKEVDTNHKKLMRQRYLNHRVGDRISEPMKEYVLSDTRYLEKLYNVQLKSINSNGLDRVMKLENSLIPVIIKMELHGCLINRAGWIEVLGKWEDIRESYVKQLDSLVLDLASQIPALAGGMYTRPRHTEVVFQGGLFGDSERIKTESKGSINYSSAAQVIEMIYRVDSVKLEKAGEDDLNTYINEHPESKLQDVLALLLEYREYDKLLSTYGAKFLKKLDANDRIHTNYSQCRTKTGRLASSGPNLQNIPGGKIREFFIASPGHKFITCDMSGAEISIAADFSGDPLLLASINDGVDMHSQLASRSFSIIFGKKVTINASEDMFQIGEHTFQHVKVRKDHKSVTFAKFYKAGVERIYKTLSSYINKYHPTKKKRLTIASRISKAFDKEVPILTKYLSDVIEKAQNEGYLRGALGRRRWFEGEVYGSAANFPIQNANAESMKMAMIVIDRYLEKTGYGRIIMNIHDEVVVEVLDEHAEVVAKKVKDYMAWSLSYFLKNVKGGATAKIMPHWEK
jgi:DNA polymerase-1